MAIASITRVAVRGGAETDAPNPSARSLRSHSRTRFFAPASMRGATVLRESCAATGELSHARRVATHVPRAGEVAARQKFFARAELALDCTVLQLTIVRRRKPPRPAMAGAACPAQAGHGAHTVAGRGGFFRWSRASAIVIEVD
jgi:hypothetical protein